MLVIQCNNANATGHTCDEHCGKLTVQSGAGANVYLLTIENPYGKPVTIDGKTIPTAPDCDDTQYNTMVTFDANGGSVSPKTMTTEPDGTLTSLATPTRRDYNFNGWFTKDGAEVTTDTIFTESTTVYAK